VTARHLPSLSISRSVAGVGQNMVATVSAIAFIC
jgi:hypothetical protein